MTLLVGLGIGFLGNLVFYGKVIGLSFPIFTLSLVAALLLLSIPARQPLRLRKLWLLVPLAFFAIMVAVRADAVTLLDMLAVLALGALTLYYLPSEERPPDEATLAGLVRALFETGLSILPQGIDEVADSWAWLRDKRPQDQGPFVAVGRGLLFALPVLAVFTILLGSADAVFASYLDEVTRIFAIGGLGDVAFQGGFTAVLGFVASGALAYGLARRVATPHTEVIDPDAEPLPQNKRIPKLFRMGIIESSIILGSVNLLLGTFVLIQFAYFFGGQVNVRVGALTYAEYARRGFFELVAVSVLTLGLILSLDHVTIKREGRQTHLFRALAIVMVGLTLVILIAASQRMVLYEDAYGYTHLRVFTHVFMRWLGVLLGIALLSVFRVRKHIFSLGVLVVMIGYLATLNVMNVDYYIAERNISRYYADGKLDTYYLYTLSAEAIPPMVELYQREQTNVEVRDSVGLWLAGRLYELDWLREGAGATIFSANLGRDRAWVLLDSIRDTLPGYDDSASRWDMD
jgi:hypothetical protein